MGIFFLSFFLEFDYDSLEITISEKWVLELLVNLFNLGFYVFFFS